jgi:hypothetical protein
MSQIFRDSYKCAPSATFAFCLAVFPTFALAETDPRAELQKLLHAQQQLSDDRQEYIVSTQEHMLDVVGHIIDDTIGLGARGVPQRLRQTVDVIDKARKLMSGDDPASTRVGKMMLDQAYDAAIKDALEAIGKEYGSDLLKTLPGRALKQVFKSAPALVDMVFDLLTLHQDSEQLKDLDRRQQDLDELREYWTKKMRGEPTDEPPQTSQSSGDAEFQRALNNLGIHLMTPSDAARTRQANITGVATSGYSQADVHIVSTADDWLALDFNGGYLIPGSGSSGSQRLGLVSVVAAAAYQFNAPKQKVALLPVFFQSSNADSGPSAYSNRNLVLVGPGAHVVIPFHSVCLDHSRGSPSRGEGFYAADRPLPGRLQRILFSASLNGVVPQSSVWSTIERESISWYDPRNDFGSIEIGFLGDDSTRRFRLGATIWVDGQVVMERGAVGNQSVSFRVPSGKHTLELMPISLEGLQPNSERTRAEVEVRYGDVTKFTATVHISVSILSSKIGISSFKQIGGASAR